MANYGSVVGGLLLGLFMAISVGPTLFAVIRYSMNHSWKSGVAFVLGVSLSDILYVTLANLAAPFLQKLYQYERILEYGGGGLLIIIGLFGLLSKYKPQRPSQKLTTAGRGHYLRIFVSGFLINSLNPAVIFNWLFAVTAVAAHDQLYRFAFFASCLGLVLGIDFLKVLLADSIRKRLTLRLTMYLNKISAGILLAFGIVIIALAMLGVRLGNNANAESKERSAKIQQKESQLNCTSSFGLMTFSFSKDRKSQ
jgi:threonine/homoserine/homoserine lactone efflux protein